MYLVEDAGYGEYFLCKAVNYFPIKRTIIKSLPFLKDLPHEFFKELKVIRPISESKIMVAKSQNSKEGVPEGAFFARLRIEYLLLDLGWQSS
jgi:hypothetical protein